MTSMQKDSDGFPIPALRLRGDRAQKFDVTATTARNTSAFNQDTRVISLYATEDMYVRVGGSDVTATDQHHFLPKFIYLDVAILESDWHIAAIRATTDGVLHISERG